MQTCIFSENEKRSHSKNDVRTTMMLSPPTHILGVYTLAIFTLCSINAQRVDLKGKPSLSFNEHGNFKILQLTDLHLGEAPSSSWGPEADRKTLALIRELINFENPDLVVLGGDQITANNIDANATVYYDLIADVLESYAIPYAVIFGNHDDADLELRLPNGTITTKPAKTSRRQLLQSERRHAHSLAREGPPNTIGVSNFMIPVHRDSNDEDDVALQIVFLDSGGGSLPQEVGYSQLETWYRSERLDGVDAVGFQHIPTQEFQFDNLTCTGFQGEGIAPLEFDRLGEVSVLGDDLHFLAVGHNHGNSYCCSTDHMLHLCFGRHSGYGGYGRWDRGGRVFEIKALDSATGGGVEWRSWVRLHNGEVTDEYNVLDMANAYDS
jgi:hypothetical protein